MKNKLDSVMAVQDVIATTLWFQNVFGWRSGHGGDQFDILRDESGEVVVSLYKWAIEDHPTMEDSERESGYGLIFYLRTDQMETIRSNISKYGGKIDKDVEVNSNSHHREFSFWDINGYYWTISDYHDY